MKLKNFLLVVGDIEVSKAFYKDLFGLTVVRDFGENVILTEGLVLQEQKVWEEVLGRNTSFGSHNAELYFEENDLDAFLETIEKSSFPITVINKCMEGDWGRRRLRIYDPDRHVIEISEAYKATGE